MKLTKAIGIGEDNVKAKPPGCNADYFDALKLLIEAGKAIYAQYDPDHQMMRRLLPGETLD